ncbi:glycosyltransferase [Miltoncostaea marina]|uniref:glycosyltransferase n=1 Tax=Miltoncostaea marina TaxID=2843215 RepID=UPI001C3DB94B|nr:glycosyltransferase [Miltoncostaea marina]
MATTTSPGGIRGGAPPPAPGAPPSRPAVRGKFIVADGRTLLVKGVSYGAFAPDADGAEYRAHHTIERDFAAMAAAGFNTVRIPHTTPPVTLLDAAARHGLRVMVGLSAEQYVGYLADPRGAPDVERMVRERVRSVAGHPALLCYALGNEIPAQLARWLGRRRIERHLEVLYRAVKEEDPAGIVTYVNYPTTEYLQLPFLDAVSFNVYLESRERLTAYIARLQNIAGDRPLLMSELGLDAMRNGEWRQAEVLDWQLRTVFAAGCAGAVVFSWTDEWHRAGAPVDDWAFGLTRADRSPKPALAAVSRALDAVPFPHDVDWPTVSVVVCSYNGARTIRQTLEALERVDYPHREVIVVDDGSTDATAAIAGEFGVRLVSQANAGLSAARNTGWQAATGEIVAYLDDDAYPDPDWLRHLAWSFLTSAYAAIGGPNITPHEDPPVSHAVGHAPGGPIHVLVSDTEAEHIPGCNMAFRRSALAAIGGFDPTFRVAGDDVDACWRIQAAGWRIGFSPAAVVWHHRRPSVRAYWRQQRGYGRAEALLERKWPEKYNVLGHVSWGGSVYGNAVLRRIGRRAGRIYHGVWGAAPFQSLYQRAPGALAAAPLMPEWYLAIALLAVLGTVGIAWTPLLLALPVAAAALVATLAGAAARGLRTRFEARPPGERLRLRAITAMLTAAQPLARMSGRFDYGLAPWSRGRTSGRLVPRPRGVRRWCEDWRDPATRIHDVERALAAREVVVERGGAFDRWDLRVRGGLFGSARVRFAVEDHGGGAQLVRARVVPSWPVWAAALLALVAVLAGLALADGAAVAAAILGLAAAGLAGLMLRESGGALGEAVRALGGAEEAPAARERAGEPEVVPDPLVRRPVDG